MDLGPYSWWQIPVMVISMLVLLVVLKAFFGSLRSPANHEQTDSWESSGYGRNQC